MKTKAPNLQSTSPKPHDRSQSIKAYNPVPPYAGILLFTSLITYSILHTEFLFSQAGLWSANGPNVVTTNRQVFINNNLTVSGNTYIRKNTFIDSLLMANNIRAKLIEAGTIIADSAELTSIISSIINAAIINGTDITSVKITAQRINSDTMLTGILGCGSAKFTGTILANNISASGTTTLNNVVLNDGVTVPAFAGSAGGLLQYNSSGQMARIDFTSDSNDILTGSGTFRNITSLVPPDTKWQWIGSDLTTTANDVYIPNSLYVGKTVNIGPFKISNGGARDTIRTASGLAIISDAQTINLAADTVRMPKYVEAPQVLSSQLRVTGDAFISKNVTVGGYLSIGTGAQMISNGSYRDTLRTAKELSLISDAGMIRVEADTMRVANYAEAAQIATPIGKIDSLTSEKIRVARLSVSGDMEALNGTVWSNEVRTNTINTNDLTTNSTISSPKVITSRITSADSVIRFGDSSLVISTKGHAIFTIPTGMNGDLYIQSQIPITGAPPIPLFSNNTIINKNAGRVGIGTISPQTTLDVNGKISATAYTSHSPLIFEAPPGIERMRIDDVTGNVGIGTQNPQAKLHISSPNASNDPFNIDPKFRLDGQNPTIELEDNIIEGQGYEGINFQIRAANGVGRLISNKSVSVFLNGDNDETNNFFDILRNNTYYGSPAELIFRVREDGRVGINTDNPQAMLHVQVLTDNDKAFVIMNSGNGHEVCKIGGNGFITATGIWLQTQLPLPDYVFAEDYKRPTWREKNAYYKKFGKLMYLPSAAEVKKNGLDIAHGFVGLTRNVEENSLEINDLFKMNFELLARIEKLEKEYGELKKENETLKKEIMKIQK